MVVKNTDPDAVTVAFEINFGGEAALPYVTVPVILGVTSAVIVAVGVAVPVGVLVGVNVGVDVCVAVAVGADVGVLEGVPIGPDVRGHANAPRPRVQSESVVLPRSMDMSQIITAGRPLLKRYQTGVVALMLFVK